MDKRYKGPPRWPFWLLKHFCSARQLEMTYGDVEEVFFQRLRRSGRIYAIILFYRDAFSLLRPFMFKELNEYHSSLSFLQMLSVYLKTGMRSLRKNATSFGINFFGLLVGMTAVLLIAHYAYFELRYDRFHQKYDHIYRLANERLVNNETVFHGATTFLPVGPELKATSPEIVEQARFYYPFTHGDIKVENEVYVEEKPTFVDASYFDVFGFELLEGNPRQALNGPNKVLLTQRLAETYFGREEPLGKVIEFTFEDGSTSLEVTGILENPRADSHLKLDMLISFATLDQWPTFEQSAWFLPFYHTYILTRTDFDRQVFEQKASALITEKTQGNGQRNVVDQIHLQALKDIYLDSDLTFELGENGDRKAIYLLLVVAVLILLVAYLNYINLSTAMAMKRAREVGVRKVLGSTRRQLIHQFLTESFLINLLSLLGAAAFVVLLLPFASRLMGVNLELITTPVFWVLTLAITLLGALISGIYPAFVLSGYKAVSVLKGRFSHSKKGVGLRKSLVSIQFTISIVMIGATILLLKQTNFLMNRNPGFSASRILVISAPRNIEDPMQYQTKVANFAGALSAIPRVNSFSHSGSVPGKVMGAGTFRLAGEAEAEPVSTQVNTVDYGFFETYELDFLSGRPYSRSFETDRQALIINRAAMEVLGISSPEEALTQKIEARGREFKVLGVIENYHHSSLKTQYEPIVFLYNPGRTIYFSLNIDTRGVDATLEMVEQSMKEQFPESPFDYHFLNNALSAQFEKDLRLTEVFRVFSFLAVVLSVLGLSGLTSFIVNQRVKEIGIRKVLGASGWNILKVLTHSFNWPVLISALVATITLYFGGQQWLQGFPFRIGLDWLTFAIPLIIILSLTLLVVGCQTVFVLRKAPVKTLRSE